MRIDFHFHQFVVLVGWWEDSLKSAQKDMHTWVHTERAQYYNTHVCYMNSTHTPTSEAREASEATEVVMLGV